MKPKKSPTDLQHREPIHKKTTQGSGRGSRPKRGHKPYRGQGR